MKSLFFVLLSIGPLCAAAQFGVKGGLNFANISKASSINNSSRSGFHIGAFLAPPARGVISSRTEIIFSRQGYNYKTGSNTGNVNLDYITMPQMMSINITKYVSILIGAHMAYLINAKADSSNANGNASNNGIMNLYNKFDYGYGGGVEIHPVAGLMIGAKMNISLGKLYNIDYSAGGQPSFVPDVNVKNNLVQLYVGWRFGKEANTRQKKQQEE